VDGPLPTEGGSYLVSARRTYFDLMTKGAYELDLIDTPFPYSFTDVHAKITQDVGRTGRLNVSGYLNDERVHTPRELEPDDRTSFAWGTRAGSVSYRQPMGASLLADVTLAATSFDGDFDAVRLYDDPSTGEVYADTSLYGRMTMRDLVADASLTWYGLGHKLRAGLQVDGYDFRYDVRVGGGTGPGDADAVDDLFGTLGSTEGITTLAGYVEDEWSATEALTLRFGVRALHAADLGTEVMPRLGLRYTLSDRFALNLAAGRYAQAVHSLRDEESALASIVPYEILVPASPGTGFLVAEDVVAGVEYQAADTRIRVDGYHKRYPSLPTPPLSEDPTYAPIFATGFLPGTGSATGLELFAQHRRGRSVLMGSYALSWAERSAGGESYTPRYNRRHMLDVTGGLEFGEDALFTARLAAGSGQPYTPALARMLGTVWDPSTGAYVPAYDQIVLGGHNSERLPSYLRLDLGLRNEVHRRWFGRDVTLVPYLQVLNVLGSRNVVTGRPHLDFQGGGEIEYLPAMPTLPTFGIEWRF
jgi:hypothetical protein